MLPKSLFSAIIPSRIVLQWFFSVGLLVGLTLPSMACRLLFIAQTKPNATSVQAHFLDNSRSLKNQAQETMPWFQIAGQSTKTNFYGVSDQNHDGSGIVAFGTQLGTGFPKTLAYQRQVTWVQSEASTQQLQHVIQQTASEAHSFLGHIRAASAGTSIVEENNHPYKVVRPAQPEVPWYFMVNGAVVLNSQQYRQKITAFPWLTQFASKATHPSDSEQLFHWLMADIEAVLQKHRITQLDAISMPLVAETLRTSFASIVGKQPLQIYRPSQVSKPQYTVNAHTVEDKGLVRAIANTFMLSNGEYTFVGVYNIDVWMQVKQDEAGTIQEVVIASEPTNIAEFYQAGQKFQDGWSRWQQLPNNTLFTIHRTPLDTETEPVSITIEAKSFDAPAVKVPKKLYPSIARLTEPQGW